MIQFPNYIIILWNSYQEQYKPTILRSDFDRGPAKQRPLTSRDYKTVSFTAHICDSNYQDFLSWWANDIKRGAFWFEFLDGSYPEALPKRARMNEFNINSKPTNPSFDKWEVQFSLEMWDA